MSNLGINKAYKRKKKSLPSLDEMVQGILEGNVVSLSMAITLVESTNKLDQDFASQIINKILPHTGNSIRIGVTGVPGVGKSTFIESFGQLIINEYDKKVAVLTIDPSSQKSKGSILGDKTRMEELVKMDKAYIRPSAAGSTLGGVAQKTREAIFLCEAAGFEVIIIETVGVGQSEIAVKSMVDYFLLLMLAGAGDELQGIKRGIMEMADTIAISKSDGENVNKAKAARREFQNAVHLFPAHDSNWVTKVLTCSSLNNEGLKDLWSNVEEFRTHVSENGFLQENRKNQSLNWFHEKVKDDMIHQFYQNETIKNKIEELEQRIIDNEMGSFSAAIDLLTSINK